MTEAVVESPGKEPEKKEWVLDWELEEELDLGGGIMPLIDTDYFYDLLMVEQEQM